MDNLEVTVHKLALSVDKDVPSVDKAQKLVNKHLRQMNEVLSIVDISSIQRKISTAF